MANPTMTLISSQTVGAGGVASVTFSSIPGTYTDLIVKISARSDVSNLNVGTTLSFNGSSTGFTNKYLQFNGSTVGSASGTNLIGQTDGATATASTFENTEIYITNYAGANYKSMSIDNITENNASGVSSNFTAQLWSNTAAITSLTLAPLTNNFVQYSSFYLYGIKNS